MIPIEQIPRYTYKDYRLWKDDWELIYGYPYAMSPSPYPKHQILGGNIVSFLIAALSEKKSTCACKILYESDWIIAEDTVVRPDIMIVCGHFNENDFIRIPPVLIIEIFSEATRLKDRNTKFYLYEQYGVKYYLLADPDKKTIEYFQLVNNKYQEKAAIQTFELYPQCSLSLVFESVFA